MQTNDIILLIILGIGGLIINWNIIKRDVFNIKEIQKEENSKFIRPKKLHIKARKKVIKKVS